jgi:hypothetical protein
MALTWNPAEIRGKKYQAVFIKVGNGLFDKEAKHK